MYTLDIRYSPYKHCFCLNGNHTTYLSIPHAKFNEDWNGRVDWIFRTHSENAILMKILKSYWKYAKPNLKNYLFSISRIYFDIPASSHRAAHDFLKICSFMFQDREIFFPQEKSSYFPLNVTRFLFFFRNHSVSIFASRKWGNILHYFTLISWSVLLWML